MPNPQDTSASCPENIYQLSDNLYVPDASIPSAVAIPLIVTPSRSKVWASFLLYCLSMVIGILVVYQWAPDYITITQSSRCGPRKRALIRAFFAEGVDKQLRIVEVLPTLTHLSVFLLFAGLLIDLFSINHTVFSFAASWFGISAAYVSITFILPFHDTSYTSLPLSVWVLYARYQYVAALEICRLIWWVVILGLDVIVVQSLHVQMIQTSIMDLQFPQSTATFQCRARSLSNSSAFSSPGRMLTPVPLLLIV